MASQSEIARKKDNSISVDHDEPRTESKGLLSRSKITQDEHPLSLGTTSAWNKFFQVSSTQHVASIIVVHDYKIRNRHFIDFYQCEYIPMRSGILDSYTGRSCVHIVWDLLKRILSFL